MRKLIASAALVAVPLGGWVAIDQFQDARYERRCVKSADDIGLCYTGYAAEARRRCDMSVQPPGTPKTPPLRLAACVQAWLAYEK